MCAGGVLISIPETISGESAMVVFRVTDFIVCSIPVGIDMCNQAVSFVAIFSSDCITASLVRRVVM